MPGAKAEWRPVHPEQGELPQRVGAIVERGGWVTSSTHDGQVSKPSFLLSLGGVRGGIRSRGRHSRTLFLGLPTGRALGLGLGHNQG